VRLNTAITGHADLRIALKSYMQVGAGTTKLRLFR
jgi:hypothetical protein